jgi:hypothetical protein
MTMSDITTLVTQRETKPDAEAVLPYFLEGGELDRAKDFIGRLRVAKPAPKWGGVHNAWNAAYKGKPLYYVRLGNVWHKASNKAKWSVIPYLNHMNDYADIIDAESMRQAILDNLYYCWGCNHHNCAPGTNLTILGNELTGMCSLNHNRIPVGFADPDETTLGYIERLLGLEKAARSKK